MKFYCVYLYFTHCKRCVIWIMSKKCVRLGCRRPQNNPSAGQDYCGKTCASLGKNDNPCKCCTPKTAKPQNNPSNEHKTELECVRPGCRRLRYNTSAGQDYCGKTCAALGDGKPCKCCCGKVLTWYNTQQYLSPTCGFGSGALCVVFQSSLGKDGKVRLNVFTCLERSTDCLVFPGGKPDKGEDLLEAAIREFEEETRGNNKSGYHLDQSSDKTSLVGTYCLRYDQNGCAVEQLVSVWITDDVLPTTKVSNTETTEGQWLDVKQITDSKDCWKLGPNKSKPRGDMRRIIGTMIVSKLG